MSRDARQQDLYLARKQYQVAAKYNRRLNDELREELLLFKSKADALEHLSRRPEREGTEVIERAPAPAPKREEKRLNPLHEQESFVEALTNRVDPTIGRASFTLPRGRATDSPAPEAKPSVAAAHRGDLDSFEASLWDRARARHERISEAWTELITEPLNALTHSSLFDVSVPKTAAFIEAYGEVQDMASIFAGQCPKPAVLERYDRAVRQAEALWAAALDYAERRSYSWLPPEEQRHARLADKLLRQAADESLSHLTRMNYAKKAAALLEKIYTIKLPTEMKLELETRTRLALH